MTPLSLVNRRQQLICELNYSIAINCILDDEYTCISNNVLNEILNFV